MLNEPEGDHVLGTRRVPLPMPSPQRGQDPEGGPLLHPLPLLLPLAHWRRLQRPDQRGRREDADLGERVQVGFSINLFRMSKYRNSIRFSSTFDLYTKGHEIPDIEELKPYYQGLIDKFIPGIVKF